MENSRGKRPVVTIEENNCSRGCIDADGLEVLTVITELGEASLQCFDGGLPPAVGGLLRSAIIIHLRSGERRTRSGKNLSARIDCERPRPAGADIQTDHKISQSSLPFQTAFESHDITFEILPYRPAQFR